jgi:putative phosphoesterase
VEKMLVGLMSDTHDNLPLIDKAIAKMNEMRVALVLHAGDYVAPFVIPHFKELKSKLIGVFGNNDGDRELLKKRFNENPNLEIHRSFAEIAAEGTRIALLHGSDQELLKSLIEGENYDFIVHGHSHSMETYRKGKMLVVNPGEVCGYLTGKATVAVLDTVKREATIIGL